MIPVTTICRVPRAIGSPRRCAASSKPATPSRTCTSPVPYPAPTSVGTGRSTSTAYTAVQARTIGIAWLGTDITSRRAAAREAAAARRNLALLNEAGARIGNSLDLETTSGELLDVVVPGFCDLATINLYQGLLAGDETPRALADGSAELRRVAFASAVSDAPFIGGPGPRGRGRRPPLPVQLALREHPGAASQRVPAEDGGLIQSTLAVPMVAHDTVVGLAQFSRTKGSEPFGDRDRALAVELAARAAV